VSGLWFDAFLSSDCYSRDAFFVDVLEPIIRKHKPDLVFINPVLSYLGGNVSDAEAVGKWCRNRLKPLMHKYNCAICLVHHMKKSTADDTTGALDQRYAGIGSVERANWARAIITVTP